MIRNYDENVFLESSGIALLFTLILGVKQIGFYITLVSKFVFHLRFSAILAM